MNKEDKLAIMKNRLKYLESNGKNIDAGGVVRKLKRQIRNLEREC